MDDLQNMGNLNPLEEIQLVNGQKGQNGHNSQGLPWNNNILYMADDRERAIRDCAVLTSQVMHLGIVRLEVQAANFELKLVMFQMLQTMGQFK